MRCTFMDQQVAQTYVRVTHIRAEQGFTKEIKKLATNRVLTEELTTLMAWASKSGVTHVHVFFQCTKERWQQTFLITTHGSFHLLTVELDFGITQLKYPGDIGAKIIWELVFAAHSNKDRQFQGFQYIHHFTLGCEARANR
ncbi:Uncharacterised protein [Vibrio cholerae]|nr:Uncharacterised protein [Vibrio cholerae]